MQRQYWRFYWPLSLTSLAMLLARQCQNATLARYGDAASELALFALASSTFMLFNAVLTFVPQMTNALGRSDDARGVCLRFTLVVSFALTVPLAALALTASGRAALGWVFEERGDQLDIIVQYLRYFLPLVFINGMRHYHVGLLVQARRTLFVTMLNTAYLVTAVLMLLIGLWARWRPVETLAGAQVAAASVHLLLLRIVLVRSGGKTTLNSGAELTYRQVLSFFWPVALTTFMFVLSRPLLYSFVNRTANGKTTIAALNVAFSFAMIFQLPLNQFRHLFVTFGCKDLEGLRRFMRRIVLGLLTAMVLTVATPVGTAILRDLINVKGSVLTMARQVLWVMCLALPVVAFRNYFHGRALVERRTQSMAFGAACRIIATCLAAMALSLTGLLNHVTAALVMVTGFLTETLVVALVRRRRERQRR